MNEIVCIRCDAYLKENVDMVFAYGREDIVFCQACALVCEDEDRGKDN